MDHLLCASTELCSDTDRVLAQRSAGLPASERGRVLRHSPHCPAPLLEGACLWPEPDRASLCLTRLLPLAPSGSLPPWAFPAPAGLTAQVPSSSPGNDVSRMPTCGGMLQSLQLSLEHCGQPALAHSVGLERTPTGQGVTSLPCGNRGAIAKTVPSSPSPILHEVVSFTAN